MAWLFLKLGTIAFGGPAAHIAMMHDEVVRRRAWMDARRFMDLVGAVNLIPGPNSTELAIHLGYERARWRGLLAAGACFILPAALIVGVLAWAYVRYGTTPAAAGLLYGIKPVVIAIIAQALWSLVGTVLRAPLPIVLALGALAAYAAGVDELMILAAGALVMMVVRARPERRLATLARGLTRRGPGRGGGRARSVLVGPLLWLAAQQGQPLLPDPTGTQLARLFLTMLKIGAVLYGSGYVLLAFLRADFVTRLGWLTPDQLADAIAIGQLTPGPVFTTATFVGYVIAGLPGAVLATAGIFLPSFCLVALLTRLTGALRRAAWSAAMLDGVNAAALALMAGVSFQLARTALIDLPTVAIAAAAMLVLWRTKVNSGWLIAGGALIGLGRALLA